MKIRYTEKQLPDLVRQLIGLMTSKTLCLYGDMGSGKTALIKALVKELGVDGVTGSPTFGIVNEYHFKSGELLGYHFDFYRLNEQNEALDLGFEDYLDQDVWIFIEWPEKIAAFLPDDVTNIHITIMDTETRTLVVS